MAVDLHISKDIVMHELNQAKDLLISLGWEIEFPKDGIFLAKITSPIDKEKYILEGQYDNYKEWPILFDFIDPITNEKGTRHAYPVDRERSIFHQQGPCICLEASRKAYGPLGGPHNEWTYANWIDIATQANRGSLTTVGDVLAKIALHLREQNIYNGRMDKPIKQ